MIEHRKRFYRPLWLLVGIVAVLSQAMPGFAAKVIDVSSTKHNMSTSSLLLVDWYSTDETEVCIFCHTPHSAYLSVPLWNQYSTTMSFTVYSSPTLTGGGVHTFGLPADSTSRLCLSCHEGTTAINALANVGMTGARPTMVDFVSFSQLGADTAGKGPYLSDDLTNMHPVGFDYQQAQLGDPDIYTIDNPKGKDLKFFGSTGNFLECSTCHDPHVDGEATGDLAYNKFLRIPNTSSAMCLACHNK